MIVSSTGSGQFISRTGRYRLAALFGLGVTGIGLFLLSTMGADATYGEAVRNMVLTGIDKMPPGSTHMASRYDWPCFASGLDYLRPRDDGVPNGVMLPTYLNNGYGFSGQNAGVLGPKYDPWHIKQDPNDPGFRVDEFAPQLSFFFNAHNHLLEEIAKFRAARRLWARIMTDRFGARDPRSVMLRFHAQTAGSMLTAQQPENNIVRVTVQALAAILGGCQSLHTNSMDEALALPTESAVRTALRTQQVLAYESGVADTVDPVGGSFAVETLTRRLEEEAETYIAKIDGLGGSVSAIAFMQREIQESAYRYQQEVESRARIVVGVNDFVLDEPPPGHLFEVNPAVGQAMGERIGRLRASRDAGRAAQALEAIDRAARGRDNLMPLILDAVRARVTLGEICDSLRTVFGVHQPSVVF